MSRFLRELRRVWVMSFLVLTHAAPAFAWGDTGHQIVARIAARRLSAPARQRFVELLRRAAVDDLQFRELVGNATSRRAGGYECRCQMGVPRRFNVDRQLRFLIHLVGDAASRGHERRCRGQLRHHVRIR
jgi:hypothetical protein